MVKENLIPPTEEVRYLNNEIPSYEEFMKTYQSDEAVELITKAEWQDRVLNGPQYGPGFFGDLTKGVASVALVASYFTPAVIVTGPLTVGAGVLVVANEIKNDGEQDEIGKHVKDVVLGAAIGTAGVVLAPTVGAAGAVGAVGACCKHCNK